MPLGELAHALPKARLGPMLHGQVFEESVQVFGEITGPRIPPAGVECQAFGNEGIEAPGNFGRARPERRDVDGAADMSSMDSSIGIPAGGSAKGRRPASISNNISPIA